MKSFSNAAIINGARLAKLSQTSGFLTKHQIATQLRLTTSQAQQAIDWCRANRLITVNPYFTLNNNGSWEYGYRSSTIELYLHQIKEMQHLVTRLQTNIAIAEHALATTASFSTSMTKKERAAISLTVTSLQTAEAAVAAVGQSAATALVSAVP